MKLAKRRHRERMDVIDAEIRRKSFPNCSDLAKILEVSRKTVQRDINFMRESLNAPIEFDFQENGYYYIDANYFLPAIRITTKDIHNLKLAEKIIEKYAKNRYLKSIQETFHRVYSYLPDEYNSLPSPMSFCQTPFVHLSSNNIETLYRAIFEKRTVRILYDSFSSSISTRTVDPYFIHEKYANSFYLIAYCHKRSNMRIFAIQRIRKITILDDKFEVMQGFSKEEYLQECFSLERGSDSYKVVIKFSPKVAKYISEKTWHVSQVTKSLNDGSILFSIEARGLGEIKRWLMQYGQDAEVIEPASLRKQVTEEVKNLAYIYGVERKNS